MSETATGQFFDDFFFENVCFFMTEIFLFFTKTSWTPLHCASIEGHASTCQLLCALDGVDQNAVDINGKTALDRAINGSQVDCVRALLELNVDTSKARVDAWTKVEIVQLLEEHRNRSVKKHYCFFCYYFFKIQFEWKEIHETIVDFTIAIGHMTRSSYELMWIFNFVQLTPRLFIGDVHHDIQKLRVIDKVKASVEKVYERRSTSTTTAQRKNVK